MQANQHQGVIHQGVIRVLAVDDNPHITEAIAAMCNAEADLECVGTRGTADDLIRSAEGLRPDVILLDLDMPGQDALEAVAQLAERAPRSRVVILSGLLDQALVDRAVAAGAWGYVAKSGPRGVIGDAIRRVAAGEFFLGPLAGATLALEG